MDCLPLEILDIIAGYDLETFRGMLSYGRFSRSLSIGRRFDFMVILGFDCKFVYEPEDYMVFMDWTLNGIPHRVDGPHM